VICLDRLRADRLVLRWSISVSLGIASVLAAGRARADDDEVTFSTAASAGATVWFPTIAKGSAWQQNHVATAWKYQADGQLRLGGWGVYGSVSQTNLMDEPDVAYGVGTSTEQNGEDSKRLTLRDLIGGKIGVVAARHVVVQYQTEVYPYVNRGYELRDGLMYYRELETTSRWHKVDAYWIHDGELQLGRAAEETALDLAYGIRYLRQQYMIVHRTEQSADSRRATADSVGLGIIGQMNFADTWLGIGGTQHSSGPVAAGATVEIGLASFGETKWEGGRASFITLYRMTLDAYFGYRFPFGRVVIGGVLDTAPLTFFSGPTDLGDVRRLREDNDPNNDVDYWAEGAAGGHLHLEVYASLNLRI
jgi:hypothetical protein